MRKLLGKKKPARRPTLEPLYDLSLTDDFGVGHPELREVIEGAVKIFLGLA
jgi:hypothetical protein